MENLNFTAHTQDSQLHRKYTVSVLVLQFSQLLMWRPQCLYSNITSASCVRIDTGHRAVLFLLKSVIVSVLIHTHNQMIPFRPLHKLPTNALYSFLCSSPILPSTPTLCHIISLVGMTRRCTESLRFTG